jgi:hypothetical protein
MVNVELQYEASPGSSRDAKVRAFIVDFVLNVQLFFPLSKFPTKITILRYYLPITQKSPILIYPHCFRKRHSNSTCFLRLSPRIYQTLDAYCSTYGSLTPDE